MNKLIRVIILVFCSHLTITSLYPQNEIVVNSFTKDGKVTTERKIVNANSNSTIGSVITRAGKTHYFDSNESNFLSENDSILDIIVEFKEEPLFIKQSRNAHLKSSTHSTQALTPFYENRFREFENALGNSKGLKSATLNPKIKRKYHKIFFGLNVKIPGEMLKDIKNLPYVKRVSRNGKVQSTLTESVPLIRADKVWTDLGAEGEGITVGILDTGIDYKHPAFGGNESSTFPTDKIIGGYDFINEDYDPMDDHFHGTHCAGIVAADNEIIKGVAPKSSLYAYKVLDENGSGPNDIIIAAIEMTVDPNQDGDYSDKLDIVSMSLGGSGDPDDAMSIAVDNAIEMGVVFCIAAGNNYNYFSIGSPGTARNAITIGSTTKLDQISNFSSRGPNNKIYTIKPEIVAPGSDIYSCFPTEMTSQMTSRGFSTNYQSISGTSMATPHVAGVCALLKKLHPNWTPEQIKSALMTTAIDLGEDAMTQGAGRVDAFNATEVSSFIYPSKLDFGFNYGDEESWTTTKTITVTNENDSTQAYIITTNDLIAGVEITASSNEFTLNSGESLEIIITVNANNNILDYPEKKSMTYDGTIIITGTIDNIHLPWAFIKSSILTINSNSVGCCYYIVANEKYYYSGNICSDDTLSLNLVMPTGNYDLYTSFEFYSESQNLYIYKNIIIENINLDGTKSINIDTADAKYAINPIGVDESGRILSTLKKVYTGHILQFPHGNRSTSIGPQRNLSFYSQFSSRFLLLVGEWQADLSEEKKVRVIQYDKINGLNEQIELINSPSDFKKQDISITVPKKTESLFIFSEYVIKEFNAPSRWNGNYYRSVETGTNNWEGSIYITPDKHESLGFTTSLSCYLKKEDWADFKKTYLITPPFNIYNDSIGLFNKRNYGQSNPEPNTYLTSDDIQTNLGNGPIYCNINHRNSLARIAVEHPQSPGYAMFCGQFDEDRWDDAQNSTYKIYDIQYNIIDQGYINNFNSIDVSPGKYLFVIKNTNYTAENIEGNGTLYTNFDLTKDDQNPPQLTSLQIRNSKGVPTAKVNTNQSAEIKFSAIDTHLKNDSTQLYLRKHGTQNWFKVESQKLAIDNNIGTYYSAVISNFTNYDSTYLDLKIIAQDEAGNSMEWVLEPSFFVGLPENTPENDPPMLYNINDTTIIKDSTLSLNIKTYDPDGDPLVLSVTSDSSHINLTLIDSILTMVPETGWTGTEQIKVFASDGEFSDSTTFLLSVIEVCPVISSISDTLIAKNTSLTLALFAIDPNGDSLEFYSYCNVDSLLVNCHDSLLIIEPIDEWVGSANISVIVTDQVYTDTANFILTVLNTPPLLDQINDTIIGKNSIANIELNATDLSGDSLTFNAFCNNANVVTSINETVLRLTPTTEWVGHANILVTVSDREFSDSTNFLLTVESFTGIDDIGKSSNENQFKIYPIPSSSGLFYLETSSDKLSDFKIEVYNINGTLVYQKELQKAIFNNQTFNIDLSNQVKGTYFIRVFIDNKIIQEKIIIQ